VKVSLVENAAGQSLAKGKLSLQTAVA